MRSHDHAPRVSLIICTTGREDRVAAVVARMSAVLDAAAAGIRDGLTGEELVGGVEALLIDNSRDGLAPVRDRRIRVQRSAIPGLSNARTTGCVHARGDVLVFTDDDVDFDAQWPVRMASPILSDVADATAAPIQLSAEWDDIESRLLREWLAEADGADRPRMVGAGMALHRVLLGFGLWDQRIGAGNADFAFGEEMLFEYQIRNAGARIVVVPDATVTHMPDRARCTPEAWRQTAYQKGLSGAYVDYHWGGDTMRWPLLRYWSRRLRLARYTARSKQLEGELNLIEAVGTADGFRRLSSEPRKYYPHPVAQVAR